MIAVKKTLDVSRRYHGAPKPKLRLAIPLTLRVEALVGDLLREAAAALLVGADVAVAGREPALEEPRAELRAELRNKYL